MKVQLKKNRKVRRLGFSLLELLAVVTILGIIAVVVIPRISVSGKAARQEANRQNISEINSAIERYYFANNVFPANLTSLNVATYFPSGIPTIPGTTTAYVIDATSNRVIEASNAVP